MKRPQLRGVFLRAAAFFLRPKTDSRAGEEVGRLFSWAITDETLCKVIRLCFDRAKAAVKQ